MKFFDRFRKSQDAADAAQQDVSSAAQSSVPAASEPAPIIAPEPEPVEAPAPKAGLFARLKAGLRRTSSSFSEGLGTVFLGKKIIDDELLEELETQLLLADVGIDATQ